MGLLQTLAEMVSEQDLEMGSLYPPLGKIKDISIRVAARVAEFAYEKGKLWHLTVRTESISFVWFQTNNNLNIPIKLICFIFFKWATVFKTKVKYELVKTIS